MNTPKKYRRRLWTDDDRNTLRELFSSHPTATVCELLCRSYQSVSAQASLMGLRKTEAYMKEELARQGARLRVVGVGSRYPKGSVPANKGKQMPPHVYEKCKGTMFIKGRAPHNTRYDGHERVTKDGYVELRLREGVYVLKHRHVWEQAYGAIPKGHLVVFKDRNPLHISLDNLELITQEENMRRNTIHRFPMELISTIRLTKKLNKKIHEKQN